MREVEFHTGIPEKLDFACRLLRKAAAQGAKVVVHGDRAALQRLDAALWTFDPLAFVPHAAWRGAATPAPLAHHTGVWLSDGSSPPPHRQVLVNLGPEVAADVEIYERVIELVAADPEDAARGRARWKHYTAAGVTVRHHPASHPGPSAER